MYTTEGMTNRGLAAALNAVFWGSGYLYSRRGNVGVIALLAHLWLYGWSFLILVNAGFDAWLLSWAPILLLGSLYFTIDGYKYPVRRESEPKQATMAKQKGVCINCGRTIVAKAKFCPECGASQLEAEPKAS